MSNITSIKDLLGKRWRLKETMYKNEVMSSNHSVYISSSGSNKNLFTYYYGDKQFVSTTSFLIGQSTVLQFTGENIYNFYSKTYYEDYGNRPRIIEFNPELTEEDIVVGGWLGSNPTETSELVFIRWWNYNTEEIIEKIYKGVIQKRLSDATGEYWLGTIEEYNSDWNNNKISATTICFIVSGTEDILGVFKEGSILFINSDVNVTQNNNILMIGG